MRRRVKAAGHWLFENGYPALFWAGWSVAASLLLLEEYFEEHSCEETESLAKDAAKKLFLAAFLVRLILMPILAKLISKIAGDKAPSHETVGRLEVEFNEGLETGVFVFETLEQFKAPMPIGILLALPAIWPIFCAFYKFRDPDFSRGPKRRYKHFTPNAKKYAFIGMEAAYNVLSLASTTSFLVTLLFNILYNSTHPEEYPYEKQILLGLIGLASIVGGASVKGFRSYRVMCYSEAFINTLYYSLNISISTAACINPESFTDEGFKHSGWIYALVFGLVCSGLAVIGGFHGTENVYESHHDHEHGHDEEHNDPPDDRQRYLFGLFPMGRGETVQEKSTIGLSNPNRTGYATFY